MPAFNSQLIVQEIADAQKKKKMNDIIEAIAVHFLYVLVYKKAPSMMVFCAKAGMKPSIPFFKYFQTVINTSPDYKVMGMNGPIPLKQLVYTKQTLVSDIDRSAHPWIYPQIFTKHGGMSLREIFADRVCFDLIATMLGPHFYIKKTYGKIVQECEYYHVIEVELSLEISSTPRVRNRKVIETWYDAADVTLDYSNYLQQGPIPLQQSLINLPYSFKDNMPPLVPA